jgi:hypothetical protein
MKITGREVSDVLRSFIYIRMFVFFLAPIFG